MACAAVFRIASGFDDQEGVAAEQRLAADLVETI
jgi:hypothetical protein